MLDRYWFGNVSRISPEAPVPVVPVQREDVRSGGGANVAYNLAFLWAQASMLFVVGDDDAGKILHNIMEDFGVVTRFDKDAQFDTIVKLRILGSQQRLLRVALEATPSSAALQALQDDFEQQMLNHEINIFYDYGKGGLTHISK